jgi:hypothetical protein
VQCFVRHHLVLAIAANPGKGPNVVVVVVVVYLQASAWGPSSLSKGRNLNWR